MGPACKIESPFLEAATLNLATRLTLVPSQRLPSAPVVGAPGLSQVMRVGLTSRRAKWSHHFVSGPVEFGQCAFGWLVGPTCAGAARAKVEWLAGRKKKRGASWRGRKWGPAEWAGKTVSMV